MSPYVRIKLVSDDFLASLGDSLDSSLSTISVRGFRYTGLLGKFARKWWLASSEAAATAGCLGAFCKLGAHACAITRSIRHGKPAGVQQQ